MAEQYSIVYMYHISLSIHLLMGHLGFFHVLAIVNSASMNTEVHLSFRIRVLSGPGVGSLDHMVTLFSVF